MENAADALIIAGGILLAILTLTLLVYMFGNINTMGTAQTEKEELERLSAWNAEWEAYNKQVLYGAEVLTVINKAQQNNIEYSNDAEHTVEVKVIDNSMVKTEIKENGTAVGKAYIEENKTSIYRCTKMEISPETGKVKWIEFEFVK